MRKSGTEEAVAQQKARSLGAETLAPSFVGKSESKLTRLRARSVVSEAPPADGTPVKEASPVAMTPVRVRPSA